MKFKIRLTLNHTKTKSILSGYRPTWCSDNKPEHNSGSFYWIGGNAVELGESQEGILCPLAPEFWGKVRPNDILRCMEGYKIVGEAIVLEILSKSSVV